MILRGRPPMPGHVIRRQIVHPEVLATLIRDAI
jgi:hypothetical protein